MSAHLEEKERGGKAWSEGLYEDAVIHFTKAIEFGAEDKEFLKVVYSNRSAARLKLRQNTGALSDAVKCVELDGNWAKGYTRKGDALYAQSKYTEAYNAYNSGLRLTPTDVGLKGKCELAMKAIRSDTDRPSSSSPPTSSHQPTTGTLGTVLKFSRYLVLIVAVLYLLPFGRGFSVACFRGFAAVAIAVYGISLYQKYGMPKLNMEYAAKIIPDAMTSYLFLAVILVSSRPYLMAMAPIVLFELTNLTPAIFDYGRSNISAVEAQILPWLQKLAPALANQNLAALLSPSALRQINSNLIRMAATSEVMQGIFLIVELLLPTRNVMLVFLWWQYLKMRFMMDQSGTVKAAFVTVDQRIAGLLAHRMCPSVVARGYATLKVYLANQVKPPQPGGQGNSQSSSPLSSVMSKCTVM